MIEINLVHNKKSFGAAKAASAIDISKLNSKMIFLAVAIMYVPGFFIQEYFDQELKSVNDQIAAVQLENTKALKDLREVRSLQAQVEQHQDQEKKLKAKLEIVREIISNRKNPYQILLYISQNIPESVWINNLKIEKNQLIIQGTASSYKSIGIFTNNLKNSIFFSFVTYRQLAAENGTIQATDVNTFQEDFEVVANIARYE